MSQMARLVSLTVLTVVIVFLGITFYQVVAPFLLPLFLAGVTAILCQPVFRYFIRRTHGRIRVSAGLTTTGVLLVLLVPLLLGTVIASLQLYKLAVEQLGDGQLKNVRALLEDENLKLRIAPYLPADAAEADVDQAVVNLQQLLKSLAGRSLGLAGPTLNRTFDLLGALLSLLLGLVMFGIALYYFLADGPEMWTAAEGLIPVHVDYQRQLRQRFEEVVRAIVLATFLAGIAQGLATSLAIYLVGLRVDSSIMQHFFIITVVATLCALVPLSGSWLVWGPCAAWCALNGFWGTALALTLFGTIVVGTMDNVIRTYVLQSDARLHPLLAFVSVLGGLQVMGLAGVFIGPIVASCLHALIKIFNTELKELSKQRFAPLKEGNDQPVTPAIVPSGEPTESPPPEAKLPAPPPQPRPADAPTTRPVLATAKSGAAAGKSKSARRPSKRRKR